MEPNQENHLYKLLVTTSHLLEKKYRAGQQHHGGNLFDLSALELLDEAINEAVDQMTYLLTLRDKLENGTHQHNPKAIDGLALSGMGKPARVRAPQVRSVDSTSAPQIVYKN